MDLTKIFTIIEWIIWGIIVIGTYIESGVFTSIGIGLLFIYINAIHDIQMKTVELIEEIVDTMK